MVMFLIRYMMISKLIETFDRVLNINLVKHPPQSHYFNVLELGYFNSIQSIHKMKVFEDVYDLVSTVID